MRLKGKFIDESEEGLVAIEINTDDVLDTLNDWDIEEYAKDYCGLIENDAYKFNDDELIDVLENRNYNVTPVGFVSNDLDYTDETMLNEIITKFHSSSIFEREKMYKQITKGANLNDFNNVDMFDHLDEQGFDFLDFIDTQEIISHVEAVGYYVREQCKH